MAAVPAIVGLLWLAVPSLHRSADSLAFSVEAFGEFRGARRLAVSPQGWIVVVDQEADRVVVFSSPGTSVRVLGGFGWGDLSFDRPTGVATDGLNIYISDEGNHRVQRFDRTLSLVASLSKRDTTVERARFGYPRGVALSRHGDLFVLDGENTRVVAYSGTDFKFLRTFGDIEGGKGMLADPLEIEITPDDRIMVLESDRIVVFDYFGTPSGSLGTGTLDGARGFCATGRGVYVVSDDRLWSFDQGGALLFSAERAEFGELASDSFVDVVPAGENLYVLTRTNVLTVRKSAP